MVRKAEKRDLIILTNLATLMWDCSIDTLFHEFSEMMAKGNTQFF